MRKLFSLFGCLSLVVVILAVHFLKASAAFTPNNLISDVIFDDSGSMTASSINSWLNSNFPNSCISTNHGFSAPDPTGYSPSSGFTYGSFVSAGQVIYDAAQAYGISPKVLLTTLQKEQSLVSGSAGCSTLAYTGAMGYGCPDGGTTYNYSGLNLYAINGSPVTSVNGTCVNAASKAGFAQQVIRGAWLLKFGEQRSEGNISWAVVKAGWDNSDDPATCYGGPMTQGTFKRCSFDTPTFYDGYITIDGSSTHMDNGATAALYWYTPHFAGNQSFDNIFTTWFGSPYPTAPWAWSYEGHTIYSDAAMTQSFTSVATAVPGAKIYVQLKARNMGTQTWDRSFLNLGTSQPTDRASVFADSNWLNNARPTSLVENTVAPGQIGTFKFEMQAPNSLGTYNEYFNLVAESRSWLSDLGAYFTINVNNSTAASNSNNVLNSGSTLNLASPILSPDTQSSLILQKDGNLVLNSNFKPVWCTGPSSGTQLVMQGDGNLVLYDQGMRAVWSTNTQGNPGARLVLQTDGNMVIYSGSTALWATYTLHNPDHLSYVNTTFNSSLMYPGQSLDTADRRYHLILQTDGNLVLYSPNRALWATGTDGKQISFLALQGDGNLVLYDKNMKPLWNSGTAGPGGLRLVIQQDGNLVLYNAFGRAYWNTQTQGQV